MAAGFKSGGRAKGVPNKATAAKREAGKVDLSSLARAREVDPGMLEAALSRPPAVLPVEPAFPMHRVEQVELLVRYTNNARTHTDESVDRLCALIKEFGWTNPILVAGLDILAGHRRLSAALKLGLDIVPVIDLSHLSPLQRRAYILADNKSALDAGWDDELLKLELGDLRDGGFDLALTGFDGVELAGLFSSAGGLTDENAAPGVPAEAVSRDGDIWSLGAHRLGCGDSSDAALVALVLNGAKPHLMVTDPPYGVEYDANWRNEKRWSGGDHGGRATGAVTNDERSDWRTAWELFPGTIAYVWHAGLHAGSVFASLLACKFSIRAQIIWVKTRPVISRGHYHWQHEPLVVAGAEDAAVLEHEEADYAVRDGSTAHWHGGRKQSTVWNIEHVRSDTGHSTQKPVECMRRPIENNSVPLDGVYEPFSGSGTTIIACEQTARACFAIEIEPRYVDVAIRRWQAFTGKEATLDGVSFADVAADRGVEVR